MTSHKKHPLIIIGAGPGGYRAAFMAADLGLEVTLIDPELNPGGVCLYRGCIPVKALIHLAKVMREADMAGEWGIHYKAPEIDINQVRKWKDGVVKKLTGGLGQLTKARKINFIRGRARFLSSEEVEVKKKDGNRETIAFENAIIATGVKSRTLPGIEMKSDRIMNSEQALELNDIPGKLLDYRWCVYRTGDEYCL